MTLRTALGFLGLAQILSACAHFEPRCSEYRQILSRAHGELAAAGYLRLGAGVSEIAAVSISEEGALLSKRLKTLCELRWEGEITEDRYHEEVRQAYQDYVRTRAATAPFRSGPSPASIRDRPPK